MGFQEKRRMGWLANLAKIHKMTKIAELGVRKGDTFLYLMEHCPDLRVIGVDLWSTIPYRTTDNLSNWPHKENEEFVRKHAEKYGNRAILVKDTTENASKQVEDDSLDLVFIDADHKFESVVKDIKLWEPKVRLGGWVSGHDIHWESVKKAVESVYGQRYATAQDNVWFVQRTK